VTKDWPEFLTGLGYVVLSFDSYAARGYSSCTEFSTWRYEQAADAYAALDYLQTLPFVDGKRVAVFGFSAGGFAINDSIVAGNFGANEKHQFTAAVSFYAGCARLDRYSERDLPLMQIAAELDRHLVGACQVWGRKTPMEVHVLKGAYHAFDQPQIETFKYDAAGNPMQYSWVATLRARELAKEFLARHLR